MKINIKGRRIELCEVKIEDAGFYLDEFNEEVTKFQFAHPFKSLSEAEDFIKEFIKFRLEDKNLMLNIKDEKEKLIGGIEVYGLKEEYPEVGIWICEKMRHQGFAEESLSVLKDYLISTRKIKGLIYEADIRNEASLLLIRKLKGIKKDFNKVTVDGKELFLELYIF